MDRPSILSNIDPAVDWASMGVCAGEREGRGGGGMASGPRLVVHVLTDSYLLQYVFWRLNSAVTFLNWNCLFNFSPLQCPAKLCCRYCETRLNGTNLPQRLKKKKNRAANLLLIQNSVHMIMASSVGARQKDMRTCFYISRKKKKKSHIYIYFLYVLTGNRLRARAVWALAR